MTLSKYALMQQASIGPLDTLSMYYILLVKGRYKNRLPKFIFSKISAEKVLDFFQIQSCGVSVS